MSHTPLLAPTYWVLNVRIHALTLAALLQAMQQAIREERQITIGYANVHALNLATIYPRFQRILNQCTFIFCDGFGVKWGARLLGYHLPERFTPPDWIDRIAEMACREQFTIFFLGGQPGVAQQAADQLQARFPGLQIVGTHHGYFDKTAQSSDNVAVLQILRHAQPDILIIGFGMPQQEYWLAENSTHIPSYVILLGGAVFDFVSGTTRRGPRWMTDHGFEWVTRLITEPRRLWRRYLIGNPLFVARLFKQWLVIRTTRPPQQRS